MKSAKITAFLSCSFSDTEGQINQFFGAVCEGLDIEYVNVSDGYQWEYAMTRQLKFTENFKKPIKNGAWAILPPEELDDKNFVWDISVGAGSRQFKIEHTLEKDNPQCVEISSRLSPNPEKGDFVEVSSLYKSKNLNRIFKPAKSIVIPFAIPAHQMAPLKA